jgi:transposase
MSLLDCDKLRKIEDAITKRVVEQYNIDLDCLLFDNTNFFTYIDTSNPSSLAKRGHCKQKRTDLKIVGLSLMVAPELNIPLFHEVYPGRSVLGKSTVGRQPVSLLPAGRLVELAHQIGILCKL